MVYRSYRWRLILFIILLFSGCKESPVKYSRGVGIYPGNTSEDFSPILVEDNINHRNIAKLRSSYNSSSYDFNLTAQLITDGIIINEIPAYISLSTNRGIIPRTEREWLLDQNSVTEMSMDGSEAWVQYELNKETLPQQVDKISIKGTVTYNEKVKGK